MQSRNARGQTGYATIWALAWLAACLTLGWVGVAAAAVVTAQHHLDGAADLAAVAAAAELQRSGNGCPTAASTAAANGVRLANCAVSGSDVQVVVATAVTVPFRLTLKAVARAGPV